MPRLLALLWLLAPAMLFALIGPWVLARAGRRGLGWLAAVWFLIWGGLVFATLPGASEPVHDFERSPLPGLFAVGAGIAAGASTLLSRRAVSPSMGTRVLVAGVYFLASFIVIPLGFLLAL